MLRRGRGGRGGRGGGGAAAPAQWTQLMTAAVKICQMAQDESSNDDEGSEGSFDEVISMFEANKRQRIPSEQRYEVIESLLVAMEDSMDILNEMEDNKLLEVQFDMSLQEVLSALLNYYRFIIAAALNDETQMEATVMLDVIAVTVRTALLNGSALCRNVIRPFYSQIVKLTISASSADERHPQMREAAANCLCDLLESWPQGVVEGEGTEVDDIIDFGFTMSSDPNDRGMDPEGFSPQNIATQVLNSLVSSLEDVKDEMETKPDVAMKVLTKSSSILKVSDGADEGKKKAALISLAVLPEAATSFSRAKLPDVMSFFLSGFVDSSNLVRAAAFTAVSEWFEHLQPKVQQYAEEVVKVVFKLFDEKEEEEDSTKKTDEDDDDSSNEKVSLRLVKEKATLPLRQICSHLEQNSFHLSEASHPDNIIGRLLGVLVKNRSVCKGARESKCDPHEIDDFGSDVIMCINNAISAQSEIVTKAFGDSIISTLLNVVRERFECSRTDMDIRSAFNTLTFAIRKSPKDSVSSERVKEVLNVGIENFKVENYFVRTAVWSGIVNLVESNIEVVKERMDELQTHFLRVLNHDYKIAAKKDDEGQKKGADGKGKAKAKLKVIDKDDEDEEEEEEDDDEEDGNDDEDGYDFNEVEKEFWSLNAERSASLLLYRKFVQKMGPSFIPIHNKIFQSVYVGSAEYQSNAAVAAAALIGSFTHLYPVERKADKEKSNPIDIDKDRAWIAGESLTLPSGCSDLLDQCTQILIANIQLADDYRLTMASMDSFAQLLLTYGSVVLKEGTKLTDLIKGIKTLLKGKAPCQKQDGEDEFAEDNEEDEEEEVEEEEEEDGGNSVAESTVFEEDNEGMVQDHELIAMASNLFSLIGRVEGKSFSSIVKENFNIYLKATTHPAAIGIPLKFIPHIFDAIDFDGVEETVEKIVKKLNGVLKDVEEVDVRFAAAAAECLGFLFLRRGNALQKSLSDSASILNTLAVQVDEQLNEVKEEKEKEMKEGGGELQHDHSAHSEEGIEELELQHQISEDKDYVERVQSSLDAVVMAIGRLLSGGGINSIPTNILTPLIERFFKSFPSHSSNVDFAAVLASAMKILSSGKVDLIAPHSQAFTNVLSGLLMKAKSISSDEKKSDGDANADASLSNPRVRALLIRCCLLLFQLPDPAKSLVQEEIATWDKAKTEEFMAAVKQ